MIDLLGPLIAAIGLFFLFRNNWVFRQKEIINNRCYAKAQDHLRLAKLVMLPETETQFNEQLAKSTAAMDEYDQYASYNEMMLRFWIWDVEKFRK